MRVIDSLSAGYRFLARRLDLLLIPLLLDLFFWLGPRLSIETLMQNFASWYLSLSKQTEMPTDLISVVESAADQMAALGKNTNLFYALASQRLFHMPTILPITELGVTGNIIQVQSPIAMIGLLILLTVIGLWIGVLYLSLLARALPIGGAAKPVSTSTFITNTFRHWARVLIFVTLGMVALIALIIPLSIIASLLMLILPGMLLGFTAIGSGLELLISIYLYFMVAAIIMDDLSIRAAIRQSLRLVQSNFWSVLGFVLVSLLIEVGFSILLVDLTTFQPPIGLIAAILLNAFIGTGLAMALLIFYRSRILLVEGKQVTGEFEI